MDRTGVVGTRKLAQQFGTAGTTRSVDSDGLVRLEQSLDFQKEVVSGDALRRGHGLESLLVVVGRGAELPTCSKQGCWCEVESESKRTRGHGRHIAVMGVSGCGRRETFTRVGDSYYASDQQAEAEAHRRRINAAYP